MSALSSANKAGASPSVVNQPNSFQGAGTQAQNQPSIHNFLNGLIGTTGRQINNAPAAKTADASPAQKPRDDAGSPVEKFKAALGLGSNYDAAGHVEKNRAALGLAGSQPATAEASIDPLKTASPTVNGVPRLPSSAATANEVADLKAGYFGDQTSANPGSLGLINTILSDNLNPDQVAVAKKSLQTVATDLTKLINDPGTPQKEANSLLSFLRTALKINNDYNAGLTFPPLDKP